MDRSLFIISTLACLACLVTANTKCVQTAIGDLEGSTVTQSQPALGGAYKYTFTDLCASSNMRLTGALFKICSDETDPPTMRVDSNVQIEVALIRGGTIYSTEYCQ